MPGDERLRTRVHIAPETKEYNHLELSAGPAGEILLVLRIWAARGNPQCERTFFVFLAT